MPEVGPVPASYLKTMMRREELIESLIPHLATIARILEHGPDGSFLDKTMCRMLAAVAYGEVAIAAHNKGIIQLTD